VGSCSVEVRIHQRYEPEQGRQTCHFHPRVSLLQTLVSHFYRNEM
jgi:hypothetical protein